MTVGDTLKSLQERNGLTTAELAAKANLPVDTINKIRSGTTRNPGTDTLQRLATALDVSLDELVSGAIIAAPHHAAHDKAPDAMLTLYLAAMESQSHTYEKALADARGDKKRWFYLAIVLIAFILLVLAWDITHPTMGYVQY